MKKFFKWLGISLLTIIGLYFIIGLFAPSSYKVERSQTMTAAPEIIFEQVSNLKNWNSWTVWARMDSTAVYTYEGTDGAVGAIMRWKGDPEKSGEGSLEVTELIPNEKLSYKLTFVDYNSVSTGSITLAASGDSTKVTWINEGDIPYMMRTMCLFMSMDAMMGPDFENGLKNLHELTKDMKPAGPEIPDYVINTVAFPATNYVGIRFDTVVSAIDSTLFSSAYSELGVFAKENKLEMIGPPVCITYKWDEATGRCELVPAFPVAKLPKAGTDRIEIIQVSGTNALCINYYGPYDAIWMAHMVMDIHMQENGMKPTISIEEYVTDPATVPTYDSVLTKLYYFTE